MDRNVNHGDVAWSHFYAQFRNSPKLESLTKSLYQPMNELHQALFDLMHNRWIDNAIGKQLDGIGEIVVMPRPQVNVSSMPFFGFDDQTNSATFGKGPFVDAAGSRNSLTHMPLPDVEYRKLLRWKIFANNGRGSMPEIVQAFKDIFGVTFVRCRDLGNAKFELSYGMKEEGSIVFEMFAEYMPRLAGTGMGMVNLKSTGMLPFGFKEQNLWGFSEGVIYK